MEGSLSCEIFELMPKSTSNSRKSLKDDFLRASVVAVAVVQMTAKVLDYWRGRRDLFPRLSRLLPSSSSRKRDLLKVATVIATVNKKNTRSALTSNPIIRD